jgi:hypothetical protein
LPEEAINPVIEGAGNFDAIIKEKVFNTLFDINLAELGRKKNSRRAASRRTRKIRTKTYNQGISVRLA